MKVLVVGGSGFIGSHVIDELLTRGNVEHIANIDTHPYEVDDPRYLWKEGSMLDYPMISNWIVNTKPCVIFNFAAIADIKKCQNQPLDAIRKNVLGNTYILQGIADAIEEPPILPRYIPKFLFASSVYVYNDNSGFYGIAKRSCEEFVREYSKRFGFSYVIFRYGTIYGPRASGDNSIKKIIRRALEDKVISYYGTGEEIREYIHVKDVARISVDLALGNRCDRKAVIVAGPNPVKARDMVRTIKDILGNDYKIEFRCEECFDHYEVTPYKFMPDVAVKYVGDSYYDFGSGLLDTIQDLSADSKQTSITYSTGSTTTIKST